MKFITWALSMILTITRLEYVKLLIFSHSSDDFFVWLSLTSEIRHVKEEKLYTINSFGRSRSRNQNNIGYHLLKNYLLITYTTNKYAVFFITRFFFYREISWYRRALRFCISSINHSVFLAMTY